MIKTLPIKLSGYEMAVARFIKLKRQGKIDIKPYKNKFGIPFYNIIKSPGQQLINSQAEREKVSH